MHDNADIEDALSIDKIKAPTLVFASNNRDVIFFWSRKAE